MSSLAAILESVLSYFVGLLLFFLKRKKVPVLYGRLMLGFFRIAVASSLAIWAASMIPMITPSGWPEAIGRVAQFGVRVTAGGLLYLILCFVLRVSEVRLLLARLTGRR